MIIEPIYAENIIVGVIYNNEFKWYVTERELWFLDYNKLNSNNDEIDDEDLPDERQELSVLNSDNANIFLQRIIENEASVDELNNLLCECIENRIEKDDVLDYSPCLLVNFDDKTLLSIYPELISFENYVPKGWTGKFEDFTEQVPDCQKYWIDESNNNLFLI